ncbi:MAG: C40 family peptidase [Clostridia bacterium]|nr:C40 family peptidase [Clostridia bacterium]
MKSKLNIKSILIIAIIGIISMVYFYPSFAANTAKVSVETANVRKTADVNATIIEQAAKGEEVEIVEKLGEWYKVKYNGVQGYLRKDLLDVEGENATESANTASDNKTNTEVENSSKTETNTNTEPVAETKKEETTNNQEQETTTAPTTNTEAPNANKETIEIYTCKENAKLKIMPLIIGNDIKEINKGETLNVLEINNKWALVESGLNRGWILVNNLEKATNEVATTQADAKNEAEDKKEEVSETNNEETTETKQEEAAPAQETKQEVTMYVNSAVINLRESETTSSQSLAKLSKGTQVTVTSENNGWSKVKVNGKEGYISSSLLSKTKPEVTTSRSIEEPRQNKTQENKQTQTETTNKSQENNTSSKEQATTSSNKGQEVCNYAKQFLGCKYVYGGTSPSGFDCSGFTQYVYKHFGVTLNRTAEAQTGNGTAVSKSNLKAGDLVIFTSHVGIYLGNGNFIHAANPSKGVITSSLSESYYVKHYITARRIFN